MNLHLPFIHRIGIGVHLTETAVHGVELVRLPRSLKLKRFLTEPVEAGDVEDALRRLGERVKPEASYVSTHLDPGHVRQFVLEGPVLEGAALETWIAAQVQRRLPSGTAIDDFVIRHSLLYASEDQVRLLVAYARRTAVEERLRLFQSAGLIPVSVGTLVSSIGHAFAFDAAFAEGWSAVLLLDAGAALLLLYEEGRLLDLTEFSFPEAEREIAVEDAAAHLFAVEASMQKGGLFSPLFCWW